MRITRMLLLTMWWTTIAYGQQCLSAPAVIPLCSVASKAAEYDGKEIKVRGVYRRLFHGAILSSPDCPHQKINGRFTKKLSGTKNDLKTLGRLADEHKAVEVVFRARFKMAREGQSFGQDCDPYEIEASELSCVERQGQSPGPVPGRSSLREVGHANNVSQDSDH